MIHVRFLLVAVIIQDIGLLLDSNNSGELIMPATMGTREKAAGIHFQ